MKNQVFIQKRILFILVTVLIVFVIQNISYGQGSAKIYWTESDKIRRANLDGSNVENVLIDLGWVGDIALDLDNSKMYWINREEITIQQADLDGSNIETVITGLKRPPGETKMHIRCNNNNRKCNATVSFNDGAPFEVSNDNLTDPNSIAIDGQGKKIYWGNQLTNSVQRANLDGTHIEFIVTRPSIDAENIELDVKNGKVYWVDSWQDNIVRTNLDGSNYEKLGTTPAPFGLALDLRGRHAYWTDPWIGRIKRSALNGDNVETLLTQLNGPTDIALDIRSHKMYWVETEFAQGTSKSKIQRANLDGINVTDILTELKRVNGIALDTEGVYDVAPDTNKLTTTWANMKSQ